MTSRGMPALRAKQTLRDNKKDLTFQKLKMAHNNGSSSFHKISDRGPPIELQKTHRMHILPATINPWELENYKSTEYLSCILTWDGKIMLTNDRQQRTRFWKRCDLTKLIPNEPSSRGNLFEVACSDVSLEHNAECLAILVVFWIEVDNKNLPSKCFGSIFRVSKQLSISFCETISASSMVACCRLTDRKKFTGDQHCLLVFPRNAEVTAYRVEPSYIEKFEDVFEFFPSLALTNLPGGTLRTACKISEEYRFSAVGLDTGILIVSVCMIEGNVIVDSCRLKFACPITVVEFLPEVSLSLQRILVSSFLGPAAIWRLHFENDRLRWEPECTLVGCQYEDSVLCACIYRFYHNSPPWILLGTFSGEILRYQLPPPTEKVSKAKKENKMVGKPIRTILNQPIYNMKQTGFNEISLITPFGMSVLREGISRRIRHSNRLYAWMEHFQRECIRKNQRIKVDYSKKQIREASKDSSDMRPRVGSTVSTLTSRSHEDDNGLYERRRMTMPCRGGDYRSNQSILVSSTSGSTSRLRQLDVDQFYQDAPTFKDQQPLLHQVSPSELKSPNKITTASSIRMGAIQEVSPPNPHSSPDRKPTVTPRLGSKKSLDSLVSKVMK